MEVKASAFIRLCEQLFQPQTTEKKQEIENQMKEYSANKGEFISLILFAFSCKDFTEANKMVISIYFKTYMNN